MKKLVKLISSLGTIVSRHFHRARIRPLNAISSSIFESNNNIQLRELVTGREVDFGQYKGKTLVLMNVASRCGFTHQYEDWEKFYQQHKASITILGFPANNFLDQETGSNAQIASFCTKNYGVSFPMFEKISVKGKDMHPLYQWLSQKKKNGWNKRSPTWNFCKYIINSKGELMGFFPAATLPQDDKFKALLGLH